MDVHMGRWTDMQTDGHTDRQTHTYVHSNTYTQTDKEELTPMCYLLLIAGDTKIAFMVIYLTAS